MKTRKKIWQPETAAYRRFQFPVHEKSGHEAPVQDDGRTVRSADHTASEQKKVRASSQQLGTPEVTGSAVPDRKLDVTRATDQRLTRESYQKGYEEGRRLGFEEAIQQAATQAQQASEQLSEKHRGMAEKLSSELESIQSHALKNREQLSVWLGQLIEEVCRQVIRREINTRQDQIITVIRETLELIPEESEYSIHVNGQDAEWLKQVKPDFGAPWQVVISEDLAPGDCRILASESEAEARLESRLVECLDIIRESLPVIYSMEGSGTRSEAISDSTGKTVAGEVES